MDLYKICYNLYDYHPRERHKLRNNFVISIVDFNINNSIAILEILLFDIMDAF